MAQPDEARARRAWWLALAAIVLAGVAIRILVWHTRLVVEDHDSIGYLRQIAALLREGPGRLTHLGSTVTPVFPVLGALFSLPGWGPLAGARLSSLVMSVVLLVASALLGRALLGRRAALLGVVLIAFAPAMVDLGVAVLTEPSYLALVYAGLVPLAIRRPPYPWWVPVTTGLFLGLAFVDRIEGIGFLVAVPQFFSRRDQLHRRVFEVPGVIAASIPFYDLEEFLRVCQCVLRQAKIPVRTWIYFVIVAVMIGTVYLFPFFFNF